MIKKVGQNNKIIVAGRLDVKGKDQIKRVYDPEGLCPTLSTMQGGGQQPKIIVIDPVWGQK